MNEFRRGVPFSEQGYAQSKMLDHSCWQIGVQSCWEKDAERLPRLGTASDLDSVFWRYMLDPQDIPVVWENNNQGAILAELTRSKTADWRTSVSGAQLKMYQGLMQGPHCAVLCRHDVDPDLRKQICTRHDITHFQPMIWDFGFVFGHIREKNAQWQRFVLDWFKSPIQVRRTLLGIDARQQRTITAVK